ncbi:hypothetical protein SS50377_24378 [Spironucleus salmonicida]|uniref:Uncharacterized protein n=1 Tax=Spironucleus salmonicida TaxID=348837 RepID=V6LN02_9EUKA|nr:hypothetical protein SS50377_24378 [Spironucleus salmonicida]|eukprot:EST46072.1 hypothetical protein SS50377_14062 [Spironucleus salmonicida]
MSQIPESVVQISYEQLDSVQSLIQFLEQQSFLYNTSWEKKLFLESGSCTIALFLLILGAKFQPQKSGRFSYTGFGISENYRLSGFRTSLLIIIQRTLILNPASWDWSVAMNVIQIFIIYQMGDGETAGCQEIVALCLDQWKQSQGCIQILQQIVDTN